MEITSGWAAADTTALVRFRSRHMATASAAAEAMKRAGIWSPPVRHPTVPKNSARLRLSLNAALSDADLSLVADALNSLAEGGK